MFLLIEHRALFSNSSHRFRRRPNRFVHNEFEIVVLGVVFAEAFRVVLVLGWQGRIVVGCAWFGWTEFDPGCHGLLSLLLLCFFLSDASFFNFGLDRIKLGLLLLLFRKSLPFGCLFGIRVLLELTHALLILRRGAEPLSRPTRPLVCASLL